MMAWREGARAFRDEAPATPLFCALVREGRGEQCKYVGRAGGQVPLSEKAIWKIVERRVKAAGIAARITPHSTRHTFITLALDGGAPLHKVQVAAGHADPGPPSGTGGPRRISMTTRWIMYGCKWERE